MKLRYQRELYRALLCWDTGKEEADLGYPLQMCLRNSIPGLLSCHGQTVDGKFCLCWDVTSRHSLSQAVGETSLPVRLLVQVLKTLQNTMECVLTNQQEDPSDKRETAMQRWQRIKEEQVLPIGSVEGDAETGGQAVGFNITGKMQGVFGFDDMEFSVKAKKNDLHPATLLRKLGRIRQITQAGGM